MSSGMVSSRGRGEGTVGFHDSPGPCLSRRLMVPIGARGAWLEAMTSDGIQLIG